MPIEGFDFKLFAKQLTEQVGPVLPKDIAEADKQYIVNIVHNFCYMAGEALSNDTTINFNAEQASIVTQFIGEWAFHKSIDIIRSGINPKFRDGILQKIAFTVFEIAKTAIIKNMNQGDMIAVVEFQVKKAYTAALDELKQRGEITEEQYQNAITRSNIDEMAQQAAAQEYQSQAQGAPPSDNYVNKVSDNKILKLATFSIVLKHLPEEKRKGLLAKFNEQDAAILRDYVNMENLENKLDPVLIAKSLEEIKNNLPEPKKINPNRIIQRLYNIVKNSNISKISNIILKERSSIKYFVTTVSTGSQDSTLPPRIADIVCNHIEEKLNR